jgi:hypothetical protein
MVPSVTTRRVVEEALMPAYPSSNVPTRLGIDYLRTNLIHASVSAASKPWASL